MKTSKIIDGKMEYIYVKNLPEEKWYAEHCGGELQILRKPIEIKEVGMPDYGSDWYDEFGVKSSNVDYIYDVNDYRYYQVTYEYIDLFNEVVESDFKPDVNYGSIESSTEVEYIYTDKYVTHDVYRFEQEIEEMANEIREVYPQFDDDENYYGDCYPDEVNRIKTSIEAKSLRNELKEEEYRDYLEDVRNIFDDCARSYLDSLKNE